MPIESATRVTREQLTLHAEDTAIQHRRLNQMVKELAGSTADNRPSRSFTRVLADLIGYLEIHQSDEEEFMTRGGYPPDLLQLHRAEHSEFLNRLRTISDNLDADVASVGPGLARWIGEWLEDHLLTDDLAYVDYFRREVKLCDPETDG